jgi:hypothetical protein
MNAPFVSDRKRRPIDPVAVTYEVEDPKRPGLLDRCRLVGTAVLNRLILLLAGITVLTRRWLAMPRQFLARTRGAEATPVGIPSSSHDVATLDASQLRPDLTKPAALVGTLEHAEHVDYRKQTRPFSWPGLHLLPDIKVITWLFSLATRAVLIAILLGVCGFLAMFGYFLVGRSWSMPVLLSSGHERVMQAQHNWLDENLRVADLDSRIQVIQRQILETENNMKLGRLAAAAEANAIQVDLRQTDLEIEGLESAVETANQERSNAARLLARLGTLPDPEVNFDKALTNRARFLSDMLALTDLSIKIAALNEGLSDKNARLKNLRSKRESLQSALAVTEGKSEDHLGHAELQYITNWSKAVLDMRTGSDQLASFRQSLQSLETLRAQLQDSLRPRAASPLVAAAQKPAIVVFVPYGNRGSYQTAQPIYHCHLWLILCAPVGTIGALVDGEVTSTHPFFRREVRGNFYSVDLSGDEEAAQELLLFSSPPLLGQVEVLIRRAALAVSRF